MRTTVSSVTVITVTFNARENLRLTLESVKSQKGCSVHHIIIDGLSSDGTQDIAQEYDLDYFVSEPDAGVYPAMEKGAKIANGDILIFLNAGDVFFDDNVCLDAINFFNSCVVDIAFGNLLPVYLINDRRHNHPSFVSGQPLHLGYIKNRSQLYSESIHHQATFYRRWIFNQASYMAPDPIANGEYNLLLSSVCWFCAKVKFFDRTISRFALGGISTSDFDSEWKRYTKAREFLRALYFRGRNPAVDISFKFHLNEFLIHD